MAQVLMAASSLASSGTAAVTVHGVGDLPGGIVFSEVRDAVKVGGMVFAVGSSSARADSTGGDTAILWSTDGGLVPLPNLVENNTAISFITASAITPDAAYIASRARSVATGGARVAVRVTRNGLTNLNLATSESLGGHWEPVSGTPIKESGLLKLSVNPSASPQWFRLFKP